MSGKTTERGVQRHSPQPARAEGIFKSIPGRGGGTIVAGRLCGYGARPLPRTLDSRAWKRTSTTSHDVPQWCAFTEMALVSLADMGTGQITKITRDASTVDTTATSRPTREIRRLICSRMALGAGSFLRLWIWKSTYLSPSPLTPPVFAPSVCADSQPLVKSRQRCKRNQSRARSVFRSRARSKRSWVPPLTSLRGS